jgi:hypothetical protein
MDTYFDSTQNNVSQALPGLMASYKMRYNPYMGGFTLVTRTNQCGFHGKFAFCTDANGTIVNGLLNTTEIRNDPFQIIGKLAFEFIASS